MIRSYISKTQKTTPKLIDTINSFRKVTGYKINFKKSLDFLYTNNEQIEKDYMEMVPFTIASKKNQIPRSKLKRRCE
jgi:hypothetical protein